MTVNKVIILGHVGQDPEKRVMSGGDSVANISIATTEKWTDKQGSKQSKTEWHKLVLYSKLADLADQYLKKGSQVYIEGKLQTREWLNKDNQKQYTTEIVVREMKFVSGGKSQQQNQQPAQQPSQGYQTLPAQPPQNQAPQDDFIEDSIPF